MDAIQVQDAPVLLERTLAPHVKLLGQALVESTDGTGTGSNSQQRLSHFPDLVGAGSGHKHLRQGFGHLRFVAAVALEDLRVELALAISGHPQGLNAARRRSQVAAVVAIAIALAL